MGQEPGILENELHVRAPDGVLIPAVLCEPPAVVDAPLIVLAPEIFGLSPWILSVTRALAREGFRAIAVETFAREPMPVGSDFGQLRARAERLPYSTAVSDLRAALDAAEVSLEPLGAIGFCMGGSLALLLAADGRRLDAVASCYGRLRHAELGPLRPEHPLDAVARIRRPVLGVYGRKDVSIPLQDVEELRKRAPGGSEISLFDAGHAFLNDTRPELYAAEEATLAWAKIIGFFNRTLT
jgi:carboxymethylenebutenolidase